MDKYPYPAKIKVCFFEKKTPKKNYLGTHISVRWGLEFEVE